MANESILSRAGVKLGRPGAPTRRSASGGKFSLGGTLARFAARCVGWAGMLALLGLLAPYTGVQLAVSAASVAACAALGLPGLGVVLCAAAMF